MLFDLFFYHQYTENINMENFEYKFLAMVEGGEVDKTLNEYSEDGWVVDSWEPTTINMKSQGFFGVCTGKYKADHNCSFLLKRSNNK